MEAGAEVVEELAEVEHFALVCDAVAGAEGLVVGEGDVVAAVVFEDVADVEPFVGEGESWAEEFFELVFDFFLEFGEVSIGGEVNGEWGFEAGEFVAEFAEVEVAGAIVFFVLDKEDGAVVAAEADDVEPVGMVGVFFAAVGDEEVEGAFGEEELVGGVVDFLAAEVPEVDAVVVAVGAFEFPTENVDALGGDVFGFGNELIFGFEKFLGEASFSSSAFADDDEFGFVEVVCFVGIAGGEVVVENGFGCGELLFFSGCKIGI